MRVNSRWITEQHEARGKSMDHAGPQRSARSIRDWKRSDSSAQACSRWRPCTAGFMHLEPTPHRKAKQVEQRQGWEGHSCSQGVTQRSVARE